MKANLLLGVLFIVIIWQMEVTFDELMTQILSLKHF